MPKPKNNNLLQTPVRIKPNILLEKIGRCEVVRTRFKHKARKLSQSSMGELATIDIDRNSSTTLANTNMIPMAPSREGSKRALKKKIMDLSKIKF